MNSLFLRVLVAIGIILIQFSLQDHVLGNSISSNDDFQQTQKRGARDIACIMTLKDITKCKAKRISALTSALPFCDIIVMLDNTTISAQHKAIIGPNVKIVSQEYLATSSRRYSSTSLRMFHSEFVGYSKLNLLEYFIQTEEYQYMWAIEDDILFTGNWGRLINNLELLSSGIDLAAVMYPMPFKLDWKHRNECGMRNKILRRKINFCYVPKVGGYKWTSTLTMWPFIKFSRRLVDNMLDSLSSTQLLAHHELFPFYSCTNLQDPPCRVWNLRFRSLQGTVSGPGKESFLQGFTRFNPGNQGKYVRDFTSPVYKLYHNSMPENLLHDTKAWRTFMDNEEVHLNQLYHPIKCEADEFIGDVALKFQSDTLSFFSRTIPSDKGKHN